MIAKHRIFTKYLVLLILTCISFLFSNAQTGTIRGKLFDSKTKEAIPFANVVLEKDGKSIGGTYTDIDGNFNIKLNTFEKFDLKISYYGYKGLKLKNIIIQKDSVLFLKIYLDDLFELPDENGLILEYYPPLYDPKNTSTGLTMTSDEIIGSNRLNRIALRKQKEEQLYYEEIKRLENIQKQYPIYEYDGIVFSTEKNKNFCTNEINDFGNWQLWSNINKSELIDFQNKWEIKLSKRYTVQLNDKNKNPIMDAIVFLETNKNKTIWSAHTDNTGKAELWLNTTDTNKYNINNLQIKVKYKNTEKSIKNITPFSNGINFIEIEEENKVKDIVDIAFVIDATGSMENILYNFKNEIKKIINKDTLHNIKYKTALLFYRDKGDSYVYSVYDFNNNKKIENFELFEYASEGGDYEEVVDIGIEKALKKLNWSSNAKARLMFLILDAPPHNTNKVKSKLNKLTKLAASKGVKIIPILSSKVDKNTELLLRSIAMGTNGTFVKLIEHYAVEIVDNNKNIEKQETESLSQIITRIIKQNAYIPQEDSIFDNTSNDTTKMLFPDFNITQVDSLFPKIKYYPYQTKDKITVELPIGIDVLYVSDISGKLIQRNEVQGQEVVTLYLSMFPSGVYFIKYEYKPNKWASGKVILIRN